MPLTSEPGGTFPVSDNKVSIEHCAFFKENIMYHFLQKNLIFFLNYVPQTLPATFYCDWWASHKAVICLGFPLTVIFYLQISANALCVHQVEHASFSKEYT